MNKNTIILIAALAMTSTVLGQMAGTLDPNFGNAGTILSDPGSAREGADVLYFPDNTILSISSAIAGGMTAGIEFAKYDIDGNLDVLWGTNGLFQPNIPNDGILWPEQAELVPGEAGFYVSGGILANSSLSYFIAKFKADGTLDNLFGGGTGYTIPTFDGLSDYGYGMTVQSDGKILMTGQITGSVTQNFDFGIARFNTDGTLDNTFGINGVVAIDYNNEGNHSYRVKVNATTGKIYAAGYSGSWIPMITALNSDGTVDNTFGVSGIVAFTSMGIKSFSLEIQSDGKLVVVGGQDATVFRLNEDGTLDNSFGSFGVANLPVPSGKDYSSVRQVALQPDGKILAGGYTGLVTGYVDVSYLARLNTDGTIDNTFGTSGSGYALVDLGSEKILIKNIEIQPDGKILTTGANVNIGMNNSILNRYLADPSSASVADLGNKKVNLYPNPAVDLLSITAKSKIEEVNIYSQSGSLIQTEHTNNFSVENLASGMYIVEIQFAESSVKTRFVKE